MITRIRGTQDILDITEHLFLLHKVQTYLMQHNFTPIETPILEPTELFVRSLGTDTDVMSKEMYTFTTGRGKSISLRPEATASTMRAFLEAGSKQTPFKVFSSGPMFRHERPQKGRWRQFTQINMEIIGTTALEHDADFLYMLDALFNRLFHLDDYVLKINFLGCPDDRAEHRKALSAYLATHVKELCDDCKRRKETTMLRIFDCKNQQCQQLYRKGPLLTDYLCRTCAAEWELLNALLDITNVNRVHDPFLVRGLDYYNKTVFECVSANLGAQDAFCGGGRYNLSRQLGAKKDYPSLGAAIGFDRFLMLLKSSPLYRGVDTMPALIVIIPMTPAQKELALLFSHYLLEQQLCADTLFETASLGNMMKKANKMKAHYVCIIGEDEQAQGTVTLKNMITGKSETMPQIEAPSFLKRKMPS